MPSISPTIDVGSYCNAAMVMPLIEKFVTAADMVKSPSLPGRTLQAIVLLLPDDAIMPPSDTILLHRSPSSATVICNM